MEVEEPDSSWPYSHDARTLDKDKRWTIQSGKNSKREQGTDYSHSKAQIAIKKLEVKEFG